MTDKISTLYAPAFLPEHAHARKLSAATIISNIEAGAVLVHPTRNPLINLLTDPDPGSAPNQRASLIPILENPDEFINQQELQAKIIGTINGTHPETVLRGDIILVGRLENGTVKSLPSGFVKRASEFWGGVGLNGTVDTAQEN